MKKKIVFLFIIPSAIALFVSFTESQVTSLAFSLIIGMAFGIGEYVYLTRSNFQIKKLQFILALIISALICYAGCNMFYQTWIPSQFTMKVIIRKVFLDYSKGLRIISILIAVMAWPSTTVLTGVTLYWVIRCLMDINYKAIWNELIKDFSGSKFLRRVVITISQVVLAALIGTLLLVGVYLLPTNRIENNVEKAAYTIQEEGVYPSLFDWATSQLDNWTDSIMLIESADDSVTSTIQDAMNVPRGHISEHNPVETLVAHYISGIPYEETINYPRYWHGYLIFLKPLLEIVDYGVIRILNGIMQVVMVVSIGILLIKKRYTLAVIPYIAAYLMLMPVALAKSIQFSACYYVFSLGCLALLLLNDEKRREKAKLIFLHCGIMTAFFDFFTYPIATFGIPMLFYLLLSNSETIECKLGAIIKNGLYWCIGFAGMWSSKWVFASIINGENIIANGVGAVENWTSNYSTDGSTKYSVFFCEIKNYMTFLKTPVMIIVIILIGYLAFKCIKLQIQSYKNVSRTLFPFFLVGFAPVVWYAFATNHSMVHYWFTNKACIVSVLAIMFALVLLLQSNGIENNQWKSIYQEDH